MSARVLTLPQIVLRRLIAALLVVALLAMIALGGYIAVRNVWAWHHYRKAEQAIAEYKLEKALAHLELCLEVWKGSAETHFLAARTARRQGDEDGYKKADYHLKKCQDLGWIKEQLQLERALLRAQREHPASVEGYLYERIRREDPDAPFIFEALAHGYQLNYRWPEALACIEKWLQLEPDNRQALYQRAVMREYVNLEDDAIADYRRVLEFDADNDDARERLADLLLRHTADYAEAAEHFQRLYDRQPGKAALALGLARAYRGLRRREDARQLLDQILRAAPRDAQALSERGRIAVDSEQYAEAEDLFRRSLAEDPADADTLADLIAVLR